MINARTGGLSLEDVKYLLDQIQANASLSYYPNQVSCNKINSCFSKTKNQAYQVLSIITYKIKYEKSLGIHQGTGTMKIRSYQRKSRSLLSESDSFEFIGVNTEVDQINWKIAIDKLLVKSGDRIRDYFLNVEKLRAEITRNQSAQ